MLNSTRILGTKPRFEMTSFFAAFSILALSLFPMANAAEKDSAKTTGQDRPAGAEAMDHQLPVSDLIGANVKNLKNEEVGEIKDIIVRSDNGEVPFAVVDFGGAFDFTGEDLFAIPFSALEHSHEDGECILNVDMVKELPGEKQKTEWLEVSDDKDPQRGETPLGDYWVEPPSDAQAKVEHRTKALSANAILGAMVQNSAGEEVGALDELIVDLDEGVVVNTVFAAGGVLGIAQEHYLLPWKSLSHSRENGKLVANVTKEMLESMPRYEGENEPPSPPPSPES